MQEEKEDGKEQKKTLRTMDAILWALTVFLIIFVVVMLVLYCMTGGIPDTLCTCVFGACGGECGAMAWIRTTKDKQRDRQYELADRQEAKESRKQAGGCVAEAPDTASGKESTGDDSESEAKG